MISLSIYNEAQFVDGFQADAVENLRYSTIYPGGLYDQCSFFLPGNLISWRDLRGGYRLIVRDGIIIVWMGIITSIRLVSDDRREGMIVEATGDWGQTLNKTVWNKPWCDNRIDQMTWYESATAYNVSDRTPDQIAHVDRLNRIRITPKSVSWAQNQYYRVRYSAPRGETIKRITANYTIQEGAQQWVLALFNETSATTVWSVNSSGSGTLDHTFAVPTRHFFVYFQSEAVGNQTPPEDGTVYGQLSNIKVYGETGSINLTKIASDVVGKVSALSSSTSWIGSNTLTLEPFYTDGYESCASILQRASSFGDASFRPWACYLRDSETLGGETTIKPLLVVEQQPDISAGYDYIVSSSEINEIDVTVDYDRIINHVTVEYQDETGKTVWITPADDATLADALSQARYGTRQHLLRVNTASPTTAVNYGRRFLAAYKAPKPLITSPLYVYRVYDSTGEEVVAPLIRAGKRLRVTDYLNEITGDGLIMLITQTEYDGNTGMTLINTGQPDPLSVIAAQMAQKIIWG